MNSKSYVVARNIIFKYSYDKLFHELMNTKERKLYKKLYKNFVKHVIMNIKNKFQLNSIINHNYNNSL